jgi:hypothetical protein
MGTLLSFIFLISYIKHRFFLATEILEFRTFLFSYLHGLLFFLVVFLLGDKDVSIWDMGGWSGVRRHSR